MHGIRFDINSCATQVNKLIPKHVPCSYSVQESIHVVDKRTDFASIVVRICNARHLCCVFLPFTP